MRQQQQQQQSLTPPPVMSASSSSAGDQVLSWLADNLNIILGSGWMATALTQALSCIKMWRMKTKSSDRKVRMAELQGELRLLRESNNNSSNGPNNTSTPNPDTPLNSTAVADVGQQRVAFIRGLAGTHV